MKQFTTSEFAKMANVTVRTIRYYDSIGLLHPSKQDQMGNRIYTENDFFELQKILSLKNFGFSLKEIRQLISNKTMENILELLDLQIGLVQKQIKNLYQVERGLIGAREIIKSNKKPKWEEVVNLIHLLNMEEQLLEQYKNSENIEVRIRLHSTFSTNPTSWFQWIMNQLPLSRSNNILELGCGNGELWKFAVPEIIQNKKIILSDISQGMLNDAKSNLKGAAFQYMAFDCSQIPLPSNEMDCIIANHMLFYVKNIASALNEISRVLRPEGTFYCSTYGTDHMKEISDLVAQFDNRIKLSEVQLYKVFGLENGRDLLQEYFDDISLKIHEDSLEVDDMELLSKYIYSCHGNQNEILQGRKSEFEQFLSSKMKNKKMKITKMAGIYICRKPRRK